MARKKISNQDIVLWRAYFEIRNERVPLVDDWSDGTTTWKPRVIQKLLWYSGVPNTMRNRSLAYDWLMQHCTQPNSQGPVVPRG
jgi:hypothetical protein